MGVFNPLLPREQRDELERLQAEASAAERRLVALGPELVDAREQSLGRERMRALAAERQLAAAVLALQQAYARSHRAEAAVRRAEEGRALRLELFGPPDAA